MAPSEDDNTPKAPDKSDKNKCDKISIEANAKEKDKEEKVRFVCCLHMYEVIDNYQDKIFCHFVQIIVRTY